MLKAKKLLRWVLKRKKGNKAMEKRKLYKPFLLISLALLAFSCGDKEDESGSIRSQDGRNIIETGELVAVNSKAFVMERYRGIGPMKIIGILTHGAKVNEGDSIIQLDPAGVQSQIISRETDLELQMANLEKMIIDESISINDYESRIQSEVATFDLKKIEVDASRFETERTRKIKELEFKQAEIRLAKEKRKFELSKIISENNLKIQRIRVRQIEDDIEYAKKLIPQLTIRTPISGVFQVGRRNRWESTLLKVSDEVYPGNNMGNVPELKYMKVITYISENDFLKIKLGQKVAVRLDALPKVAFDGEISYIGKLCRPKDWNNPRYKVFDVEVTVAESDERLKPGMTVSCEFLQN